MPLIPPRRIPRVFWHMPCKPVASSLTGGLGTPVTLALMLLVARHQQCGTGSKRIGRKFAVVGWIVTGLVSLTCVVFLWQTFFLTPPCCKEPHLA